MEDVAGDVKRDKSINDDLASMGGDQGILSASHS